MIYRRKNRTKLGLLSLACIMLMVLSMASCSRNAASETEISSAGSSQATEPSEPSNVGTESSESSNQAEVNAMLKLQIADNEFFAELAENSTVDALIELLSDGPLTLDMSDYAGMEKGADLGVKLPQNNQQMDTSAGDIILYQGRTFVIYYNTNSWSLTPIGKIKDTDADTLRKALGAGDVTVTLSIVYPEEEK